MRDGTAPDGDCTASGLQLASGVPVWLASAHSAPAVVHREWGGDAGLALIPLGRRFEAVRIPESVARHALDSGDQPGVTSGLARHLQGGPVIHDPGGQRYYALVPTGTALWWRAPAAKCLGEGTYLGVPRADLIEGDERTRCSYWAVPMAQPGELCRADDVLSLVMVGACLAEGDGIAGPP